MIVENISGMPLEDYVSQIIFEPLGMKRTTFMEPSRSLYDNVSYGHIKIGGTLSSYEDPSVCYPPAAGGMSTTAVDMAKYMIMHLNNGEYEGADVIGEDYMSLMHERAYGSDNRLPGIALGLMQWRRNNLDIVWHSGGNATYKSMVMLIPNEEVGLFISYNAAHAEESRNALRELFLNRFYPVSLVDHQPIENYKERVDMYAGDYKEARGTQRNSDKLLYFVSRTKTVEANTDGTLTFRDTNYIEVEEGVFREVDGQGILVFEFDDSGLPTRAFQDFEPHEAYIKIPLLETSGFIGGLYAGGFILMLLLMIMDKVYYNKAMKSLFGTEKIRKVLLWSGRVTLLFPISTFGILLLSVLLNPILMVQPNFGNLLRVLILIPVISLLLLFIGSVRYIKEMAFIKENTVSYISTVSFILCGVILHSVLIYFRLIGVYII